MKGRKGCPSGTSATMGALSGAWAGPGSSRLAGGVISCGSSEYAGGSARVATSGAPPPRRPTVDRRGAGGGFAQQSWGGSAAARCFATEIDGCREEARAHRHVTVRAVLPLSQGNAPGIAAGQRWCRRLVTGLWAGWTRAGGFPVPGSAPVPPVATSTPALLQCGLSAGGGGTDATGRYRLPW